jgi:hypothetical protein
LSLIPILAHKELSFLLTCDIRFPCHGCPISYEQGPFGAAYGSGLVY